MDFRQDALCVGRPQGAAPRPALCPRATASFARRPGPRRWALAAAKFKAHRSGADAALIGDLAVSKRCSRSRCAGRASACRHRLPPGRRPSRRSAPGGRAGYLFNCHHRRHRPGGRHPARRHQSAPSRRRCLTPASGKRLPGPRRADRRYRREGRPDLSLTPISAHGADSLAELQAGRRFIELCKAATAADHRRRRRATRSPDGTAILGAAAQLALDAGGGQGRLERLLRAPHRPRRGSAPRALRSTGEWRSRHRRHSCRRRAGDIERAVSSARRRRDRDGGSARHSSSIRDPWRCRRALRRHHFPRRRL